MLTRPTIDRICGVIKVIGVLNFLAFVAVALWIGGDAVNGHTIDGRFFLSNHGKFTEVSEAVYRYSYAHAVSVWITFPMAFLVALLQQRRNSTA